MHVDTKLTHEKGFTALVAEKHPRIIEFYNKIGSLSFLVGDSLTIVDMDFFCTLEFVLTRHVDQGGHAACPPGCG